jgi:hypothetical protein
MGNGDTAPGKGAPPHLPPAALLIFASLPNSVLLRSIRSLRMRQLRVHVYVPFFARVHCFCAARQVGGLLLYDGIHIADSGAQHGHTSSAGARAEPKHRSNSDAGLRP